MEKIVLIFFLLFGLATGLRCFYCSGDNSITSKDDRNCLNPKDPGTYVLDEIGDEPCTSCSTWIADREETEAYFISRGCGTDNETIGCIKHGKLCYCNDKDLCNEDFSFPCYGCYYSSNGGRASLYGLNYESNEKCKNVEGSKLQSQCKTRCFTTYEKLRNPDGGLTESITRGCEPTMNISKPEVPNYRRCPFDLCNNISLSSVPEPVINTTTQESSFATGDLNGLTFMAITMFISLFMCMKMF